MSDVITRPEIAAAILCDPWFDYCLHGALECREFVVQFDRMYGTALATVGTGGINAMVDEATGRTATDVGKFVEFVYEYIYLRCPRPEAEGV